MDLFFESRLEEGINAAWMVIDIMRGVVCLEDVLLCCCKARQVGRPDLIQRHIGVVRDLLVTTTLNALLEKV